MGSVTRVLSSHTYLTHGDSEGCWSCRGPCVRSSPCIYICLTCKIEGEGLREQEGKCSLKHASLALSQLPLFAQDLTVSSLKPSMVVHICNFSTREAGQEDQEFEASLL